MTSLTKGIFIVGAKRTPFGTFGGKLAKSHITDLQVIASKGALAAANVKPELVDTVVIGNVIPSVAADGGFLARHVLLKSGIPLEKPAFSVNRLCGSGFQSLINGLQDISTGVAEVALTGGVENMSSCPYIVRNIRFGNVPLGTSPVLEDTLWLSVLDTYCNLPMALTAEKLGEKFKLTKDEIDEFAFNSQQRWKAAQDAGKFKDEIVPVPIKEKKEMVNFEVDEHPRPWTTLDMLKKLPTIFKKDGLVTAGTASGISDGAGAVVVASEAASSKHNLKPLARIVAHSVVGVDPSIMGFGPAPAIRNILKATGKTLDDIDLIEINEAFGAQTLACAKDLKLDMNKLNVNGGAIALGHPLAASGSRIIGHLVYELKRRNAKYGIGSACIGGGQGIAVMIENL
ncbi:3-ketoacyl-CoA thiolase, mitochondrial isoform X1 [Diabrotica virgifera virgifera]|uniref:3-ketoacyl-CoA thiolase, mitochondrial isoform X1 n=1 Tax=Diabrotica virgifera virgifera TaxID=50390 RepID=A0A6P7GQ85_DIAVI|nr:3-ketoacyl-CoA thiolase, mitochondrial isoform X1 [Diabrotica virgifera virgifera]